jgi:hypothetical protein
VEGPTPRIKQTGGHGIERAGVANALFVQDPSHVTHHVVTGHPLGLIDEEEPVIRHRGCWRRRSSSMASALAIAGSTMKASFGVRFRRVWAFTDA